MSLLIKALEVHLDSVLELELGQKWRYGALSTITSLKRKNVGFKRDY